MPAARLALIAMTTVYLFGVARGQVEPNEFTNARIVLDRQVAAWNRGDLDSFMADYWKSERLRFVSGGTITAGWQATYDRYNKRYKSDGREMGKLSFSDLQFEGMGANKGVGCEAVLVVGRWKVTTKAGSTDGTFTVILGQFHVRDNVYEWKIIHDHTSASEPAKKPE